MRVAEVLILLAQLWAAAGGLTAAAFLLYGIDCIDAGVRRAYVFRPLLIPGIVLLWLLVLWRWLRLERER